MLCSHHKPFRAKNFNYTKNYTVLLLGDRETNENKDCDIKKFKLCHMS